MDALACWGPYERIESQAPPGLRSWLVEPGLLTARIRALCGERMRFRMLAPLRHARLTPDLAARLGLEDRECLLREIEFRCARARVVFAQTVLPESTVRAFPWLGELGDSPIGESLRRAGAPLERDPLEFAALPAHSVLARAAAGVGRERTPGARARDPLLWARRAVYRLDGCPILVQEVFLPALLELQDATLRGAAS